MVESQIQQPMNVRSKQFASLIASGASLFWNQFTRQVQPRISSLFFLKEAQWQRVRAFSKHRIYHLRTRGFSAKRFGFADTTTHNQVRAVPAWPSSFRMSAWFFRMAPGSTTVGLLWSNLRIHNAGFLNVFVSHLVPWKLRTLDWSLIYTCQRQSAMWIILSFIFQQKANLFVWHEENLPDRRSQTCIRKLTHVWCFLTAESQHLFEIRF